MTCSNCGMPATGDLCSTCATVEHQEARYGVPSDHIDDSAPTECDGCGFSLLPTDSECPECGRRLEFQEVNDGGS